jgi:hypothetical protein
VAILTVYDNSASGRVTREKQAWNKRRHSAMEPWQKRQRFADRLSQAIGAALIVGLFALGALHTTLLSAIPFPKSLELKGDHEEFVSCFLSHSKLAKTNRGTSFTRDTTAPEGRIRLAQIKGFLGPAASRVLFVDVAADGFELSDGFYESAHERSRPIRKYDWVIAWLCGTGNL